MVTGKASWRIRSFRRTATQRTVSAYDGRFDGTCPEERRSRYDAIANEYYQLVTDFYELGWGRSFHFAPRRRGESFSASLARHQELLALKLRLRAGQRALDLGCGVGGPMRHLASRFGTHITGVNINAYQVAKARRYAELEDLAHLVEVVEADFLRIPFAESTFDAAYAIEATCHAPNKPAVYAEAARILKPGGLFGAYEWCLTPDYDDGDPQHRRLRHLIERGNGIASLATFDEVQAGLRAAGLELLEVADLAVTVGRDIAWHRALSGRELSWRSVPRSPWGRAATNLGLAALERLRIAPTGTHRVSTLLNEGADALVAAGERGLFTPMYFFLARKPR